MSGKDLTRHARTRWEYGSQPGRSEIFVKAIEDDPVPHQKHRSKVKDTVTWCRGKPGVPHKPVTVLRQWSSKVSKCRYHWSYKESEAYWWCLCEIICQECRKILESSPVLEDCLHWAARSEEQKKACQAEAEARLEILKANRSSWSQEHSRRRAARIAQMGISGYRKKK